MTGPLMVIAGGLFQLPLIARAQRRGLKVWLLDGNPDAPGFAHADGGEVLDIADELAVIAAARRIAPAGIASISSEIAVRTGAAATEALGLPGLSVATATASTDKFVMRSRFQAAGLTTPPFRLATSLAEGEEAARDLGYPLVVKPVDSSGSRGVRRVDSSEALGPAVELALENSRGRRALLEGFLDGRECTVEAFTVDGHTEILGISDKDRLPFPECVSINLTYSPDFTEPVRAAVADAARAAIAAVGLTTGPSHIEIMVTPTGPVLVELAARGGGYRIFTDILPAISGVDPVDATIDHALGLRPNITPTVRRAAVLRFFNPSSRGTLASVSGMDTARSGAHILDVVIDAEVGKPFHGITRDGERPGYIISIADDRPSAVAAADAAEAAVTFDIVPAQTGDPAR